MGQQKLEAKRAQEEAKRAQEEAKRAQEQLELQEKLEQERWDVTTRTRGENIICKTTFDCVSSEESDNSQQNPMPILAKRLASHQPPKIQTQPCMRPTNSYRTVNGMQCRYIQ